MLNQPKQMKFSKILNGKTLKKLAYILLIVYMYNYLYVYGPLAKNVLGG